MEQFFIHTSASNVDFISDTLQDFKMKDRKFPLVSDQTITHHPSIYHKFFNIMKHSALGGGR